MFRLYKTTKNGITYHWILRALRAIPAVDALLIDHEQLLMAARSLVINSTSFDGWSPPIGVHDAEFRALDRAAFPYWSEED